MLAFTTVGALAPWIGISMDGNVAILVLAALLAFAAPVACLAGLRLRRDTAAAERSRDEAQSVSEGVFAAMDEGVLIADVRVDGMPLTYVNAAFTQITGYSAREALGKNCRYLQGADRLQPDLHHIRAAIEHGNEVRVTLRNYRKDGSLFWNDLRLLPVFGQDGKRTHFIGIMRDVTELQALKSRLEQVDHLDRLTSVSNRYSFYDKLATLLQPSGREAVLVAKVDVAHFHEINTSYGFETGDLLLMQVAKRLKTFATDTAGIPDGDAAVLVGRLAADEFAVAARIADAKTADTHISRLRDILLPKFVLLGATIDVRFAIGFAVASPSEHPTTIMRNVGMALQASKRSRSGAAQRFTAELATELRNRIRLTAELQQALSNGDLELHFQPKVEIASGKIIGAEALVRWRHPVFGLQHPALFIPRAEETGLICDIGAWAFRSAARFSVELNQARAEPVAISVNVSPLEFLQRDMSSFAGEVLQETGADPATLILELTESLLADSSPQLVTTFRYLRAMGLGLSIDDFGTGYSSLRSLDAFPISEVKIDQSFVQGLHQSPVKKIIVETVIKLAATLDILVTAEGVETEEQRAALLALGCGHGQGYLFGRPVPADEFLRLANQQASRTAKHGHDQVTEE